ncbi:hypothetical protein, partial [Cronobacter malonaticus]|uniref:hypothetical protein n=1 Tax=Cronobacter malonaticus TaxID=413503 RepID=UPI001F1BC174
YPYTHLIRPLSSIPDISKDNISLIVFPWFFVVAFWSCQRCIIPFPAAAIAGDKERYKKLTIR